MTVAAPSGAVTFLFTDVEGSTRRWEANADAIRAALAAHDEVLRSAIEARGGFLFKHTGDGICAAFASPRARSGPDPRGVAAGISLSSWKFELAAQRPANCDDGPMSARRCGWGELCHGCF
jgi:class 3 adenylate cyclase